MKTLFSILFSLFSIVAFSQYKVTKIDKEFGLMSDNVRGIWQDSEGYIWVADEIGFNRINGNEVINFWPDSSKLSCRNIEFDGEIFKGRKSKSTILFDKKKYRKIEEINNIGSDLCYNRGYIEKGDTVIETRGKFHTGIGNADKLELFLDFGCSYPQDEEIKFYNNHDSIKILRSRVKLLNPVNYDTISKINAKHNIDLIAFENVSHPVIGDQKNLYLRLKSGGFLMITPQLDTVFINIKNTFISQICEDKFGGFYVISYDKKWIEYFDENWVLKETLEFALLNDDTKVINQNGETFLFHKNSFFKLKKGVIQTKYDDDIAGIQTMSFSFIQVLGDTLFYVKNSSDRSFSEFVMNIKGQEYILFHSKNNYNQIAPIFVDKEKNIWIYSMRGKLIKVSPSKYAINKRGIGRIRNYFQEITNTDSSKIIKKLHASFLSFESLEIETKNKDNRPFGPYIYAASDSNFLLIDCSDEDYSGNSGAFHSLYLYSILDRKWKLLDSYRTSYAAGWQIRGELIIRTHSNTVKILENNSLLSIGGQEIYTSIDFAYEAGSILILHETDSISFAKLNSKKEVEILLKVSNKSRLHLENADILSKENKMFVLFPNGDLTEQFNWVKFDSIPENVKDYFITKHFFHSNKLMYINSNRKISVYNLETGQTKELHPQHKNKTKFVNYIDYKSDDEIYIISENIIYEIASIDFGNNKIQLSEILEFPDKISPFFWIKKHSNYFVASDKTAKSMNTSFTPPFTSLNSKFRSVKVFDNEKEFIFADSTLEGDLNLDYNQNNLTIRMETITNFEPETVYYLYQLEGPSGSDKWIRSDVDSVQLSNLAPGKYTYRFKSVNGYGIESEIHEYSFTIHPPWYATWWFRGSAGAGLLLIFFAFYKGRTAQMRKRQKVLENTVEERTKEVVEQKEEVEKQRDIAHHQKEIVEEKNKEILDSISYAKRLQNAILPPPRLVKEWLNDSFIFYKPKDIVAGDFYWMETTKRDGRTIVLFAAADCTGHGVPGAMVSVVCSNAMNRAIKEFGIHEPGLLLDKVVELVKSTFEQSEDTDPSFAEASAGRIKDGMDIALCALDLMDRKVWFAGAHNPLYRVTNTDTSTSEELRTLEVGERKLVEYKASKQPVGAFDHMEPFKTTEIQLEPGDCIYLFSDGYADQFGGEKGKKYKYANFKKLLMEIESKEMDTQKEMLDLEFNRWKGELEQIDDICIIGLRVNGHMRKLFSKRELEVIQKIKEGKSSKMIADDLNIAKTTVDTHRKRILSKVNLHSAPELIKFCEEHEIL